jgi:IS5 family transposase
VPEAVLINGLSRMRGDSDVRFLGGGGAAIRRRYPTSACRKRALLHGDESAALGDAGYQGVEKRPENFGKPVTWHVAMKRSKRKALPNNKLGRMTEKLEHLKASVRAKVEHPFHVIKNLFRHRKNAVPRPGEEHSATVYVVRICQPGAGWPAI